MNLRGRLVERIGRHRRIAAAVLVLAVLVVAYGVVGYWVLPGIIQSQAERSAADQLHRVLTIERVQVQPFALRVRLYGASLREADARETFASAQELQARLSLASLWYRAPVVKEVRIEGPTVHLVRLAPNRYNTDDIVAALGGHAAASTQGPPARFSIYNIRVEGGRIDFDDRPLHAQHSVRDLRIGVPFVSSLPSKEEVFVEPLLSAVIDGAALSVKGKVRPFAPDREAFADLDLERVEPAKYLGYLPFEPNFRIPSAELDLHVHAAFRQPDDKPASVTFAATARLRSFRLTTADGAVVLDLPQLQVVVDSADPLNRQYRVADITMLDPKLNAARDAQGRLDLALLMPQQSAQAQPAPPEVAAGGASEAGAKILIGRITLRNAQVHFADSSSQHPLKAALEGFNLNVGETALDLSARKLAIGQIDSDDAHWTLQQGLPESERAGRGAPLPPQSAAPAEAPRRAGPTPAAPSSGDASGAWEISVGHLAVDNWSAHVRTLGLPRPAVTDIGPLSLHAQSLSNAPASAPGTVDLKAKVNRGGSLSVTGGVGIVPLHADLALDLVRVDLVPVQPYVTEYVNLLMTSAELAAHGRLQVDQTAGGGLKGGFRGAATLGNLATIDKVDARDFANWKSLSFEGVDARLSPLDLNIERVALAGFFARVIIDPTGRINLQDIVRSRPGERRSLTAEGSQAAPPAAQDAAASPSSAQPAPVPAEQAAPAQGGGARAGIRIAQVTLEGGRVQYTDNFIKPNYSASLDELGGTVTGLSSEAATAADVDVHGNVAQAPLTVSGRINPVRGDLYLDLKGSVQQVELPPLSPYSEKYIGYGIERGKLSFDVAYTLEHRQLTAQNRLVLNQLTFSDKVDSPSATTLPVRLAVALLKDRNGVIAIDLPIGGSLDDPQFSVGGLIVKVLVNLVTKAVTSPFAWLGGLSGHGEELSYIDFPAGSDDIDAKDQEKLDALAKAMLDRPGLNLDIQAQVDRGSDAEGLRQAELDRRLQVNQGGEKDRPAQARQPAQAKEPAPTTDAAQERAKLLAAIHIGDAELIDLGNRRSQKIEQWLQTNGHVPRDRLAMLAPSLQGSAAGAADAGGTQPGRVKFSLK